MMPPFHFWLAVIVDSPDFASIPPTGLMSTTFGGYTRDKHSDDQNPQIVPFPYKSNMYKAHERDAASAPNLVRD